MRTGELQWWLLLHALGFLTRRLGPVHAIHDKTPVRRGVALHSIAVRFFSPQ